MPRFEVTEKQKEYLSLLKGDKTYVLAYGGSRSGKTRATIEYIFRMCMKHTLRAVVLRQTITHARASVWAETILAVAKSYANIPDLFKINQTDLTIHFINGSELIVGGLDDAERIEKILGREFAIIYFNESSQISYEAVNICKTRLAQVVDGFKNKFIFDCNPPPPTHWIYKTFIEKLDFKTGKPLEDEYAMIRMNPIDNSHLSKEYLSILDNLPERERRRFRDGEFVKIEGAIYADFDIHIHVIKQEDLPQMEYFTVGIDNTGTNFAAVLIGWSGGNIYILDEKSAFRETMQNFDANMQHSWRQYNYVAYPDPAAAQLNDLIWNAAKSDNSVEAGINYIREKINNKQFFLLLNKSGKINTPGILQELNAYRYDDKGRILKENDHFLDSIRYGVYSHAKFGASIIKKI
jgi:PBSX family phage terminase large subunit